MRAALAAAAALTLSPAQAQDAPVASEVPTGTIEVTPLGAPSAGSAGVR